MTSTVWGENWDNGFTDLGYEGGLALTAYQWANRGFHFPSLYFIFLSFLYQERSLVAPRFCRLFVFAHLLGHMHGVG